MTLRPVLTRKLVNSCRLWQRMVSLNLRNLRRVTLPRSPGSTEKIKSKGRKKQFIFDCLIILIKFQVERGRGVDF